MKSLITGALIAGLLVVVTGPVPVQGQDDQKEAREGQRESRDRRRERRRRGMNRAGESGATAPRRGEKAPEFELESWDGKSKTRLAEFRGVRPVVLIFGSYT